MKTLVAILTPTNSIIDPMTALVVSMTETKKRPKPDDRER